MASDISVVINPPNQIDLSIGAGITKHAETHAPGGSDTLSAYYATGSVVRPSETGSFITSGQTGQFVSTGSTGSFVTGSVVRPSETGAFLTSGSTGNFITSSQTGQFVSTGSTGNFIISSQTGQFVGTGQTGNFVTSSQTGIFITGLVVRPSNTGAFLDTGSSQTINSLKNFLTRPTVNGTGVLLSGEASALNTGSLTGVFYPLNSNPSGYITGVDLTNYVTKSSTGIFVTTGQTGNFITASQTGAFVSTGSTGSFITASQTGQFVGTGQTGNFVTGSVIRPSETGSFITTSQTGQFVSTGSTGSFITGAVVRPSETGAFITTGQTGVFITSSQTGQFVGTGSTGSFVTGSVVRPSETGAFLTTGSTGNFITSSQTGQFVSTGATGSFVTGSVVRPSETGNFITTSQTGRFVGTGATGGFAVNTQVVFITGNQDVSGIKNFYSRPTVNGTGVLLSGEATALPTTILYTTGNQIKSGRLTIGDTIVDSNYPYTLSLQSNNNNTWLEILNNSGAHKGVFFGIEGNNFEQYNWQGGDITFFTAENAEAGYARLIIKNDGKVGIGTNSPSEKLDVSGNIKASGATFNTRPTVNGTGVLLSGEASAVNTGSLTGVFYPLNSNPSGYITGVDLSAYVTTGQTGQFVTGSVVRPSETGNFITTGQTGQFVWTGATGSFVTTGQTGVFLTSGSPIDTIQLYAKNDQGSTIYKGNPVYIGGANGANPLIKLASNTGEPTSSKTIGLLAQDLSVNAFGYIITEGILEGFDTSSGNAGDPMWLGTGGNIIYGLANKPYGNNHLVYLGVVLRSNNSNGKVYVKPQNGFEIEELHRVYAKNASTNDTLMYNSGSGSWFARQINTGDVSGISAYALAANTGSFITTGQTGQFVSTGSTGSFVVSSATGAFLTTGAADGRYTLQSATGAFVVTGQTGAFAAAAGTGAFLTTGSQSVQEIYIDAGAMLTGVSGASPSSISVSNSGIAYDCFNFDASISGYAHFKLKLPDYNLGNLKARFDWTTSGASGGVVWGIQGFAARDGDLLTSAWGTPQEISDSFVTGTGLHVTSATPFITLTGSPQANGMLFFRIYRNTFHTGDTLAVNASLLGVKLQYTGTQIQSW